MCNTFLRSITKLDLEISLHGLFPHSLPKLFPQCLSSAHPQFVHFRIWSPLILAPVQESWRRSGEQDLLYVHMELPIWQQIQTLSNWHRVRYFSADVTRLPDVTKSGFYCLGSRGLWVSEKYPWKKWPLIRVLRGELEIVKGERGTQGGGTWAGPSPPAHPLCSGLNTPCGAYARTLPTLQELWTQRSTPNEQSAMRAVEPWEGFSTANQKWFMSTSISFNF